MALSDSNTYIEPTAGTTLSTARLQQNQSKRSLKTNLGNNYREVYFVFIKNSI